MAKVKYLDGKTEQYGYVFDGAAVEVTNEAHLAKFRGNPFFAVEAEVAKPDEAGLKAEHHGGGKFNITRGEEVLAKGLSKADADAFNALSDEEKEAFVAAA